ncbi:MAG: hypothetical protein IJD37_01925 [Clostridia bacterium]|nr:hypothetical protein [Clostridia bacterium]
MAPEQVRILTITDRSLGYAKQIKSELSKAKYRFTLDDSQNTLKYKIRNAQMEKVAFYNNTTKFSHKKVLTKCLKYVMLKL